MRPLFSLSLTLGPFADPLFAVSLNKDIKKNAKKDKKKAAKINAKVTEVEKEHGEDAEMPSKPRGRHVVSSMDVDEAYVSPPFSPLPGLDRG